MKYEITPSENLIHSIATILRETEEGFSVCRYIPTFK